MKRTPSPSITSRARTGDTHWLTLTGYAVLGVSVTLYLCWTVVAADASPRSFLSGVVLTVAGVSSFFAYMALFRDSVHLSHTELERTPGWVGYLVVGFAVPVAVRVGTVLFLDIEGWSPVVVVYSLVLSTTVICLVYLYRRPRYDIPTDHN